MESALNSQHVLVVGLGITGSATAIRLNRLGWKVTVIERAPARRGGGYFIALFGAGRSAAKRLGMLPEMHDRVSSGALIPLTRSGKRRQGMALSDVPDVPWIMLRGDVERAAAAAMPAEVDIRFSTVPVAIEENENQVQVTMRDVRTGEEDTGEFDLVVGADGLRSTVRELVFGPAENYVHRLNKMICAFEYRGTPPFLQAREGAVLAEEGRGMWVFPFADHDPTVLFTWDTDDIDAALSQDPVSCVREAFGPQPAGPIIEACLQELARSERPLLDSAEQVVMGRWSRGRVVLVGDAAWCVTLYAGMGASSGLSGADLLGQALEQHPDDIRRALTSWEQTMRPYVEAYQRDGRTQGTSLEPRGPLVRGLRSLLIAVAVKPKAGAFVRHITGATSMQKLKDAHIMMPELTRPS